MGNRRMRASGCWVVVGTAALLMAGGVGTSAPAAEKARPQLGMNLAGPADWSTELPFVDVFRLSRKWISQRRGAGWGKGPELELDEHGWVKRLQPNCYAETLLCTIDGGHYPSGRYTVLYKGRGRLEFGGAARVVQSRPGRMVIDVDSSRGTIFLRLVATDPSDYLRDIHVIMPGFERTWRQNPFHPVFLKRWKGVTCFRFMDWMKTNGSTVRTWSDRPALEDATFTVKGVPLELMIDLCNRQDADAWFCMPHMADDDYVRNFARMVRERLEPERKVYLEYSNEVWNSMFPQTRYAREQAQKLNLGPRDRPWEGGGMYYVKRSVEIFRIWQEVFGGTDRLVRVLCWQAVNPWWIDHIILPYQDAYKQADALGIAPYVSMNVPARRRGGNMPAADEVARWSVEKVLDYVERESLPRAIKAIQDDKRLADKYGLKLVAYEGGQHLVGVAGGENNERLTRLFLQANADPRMGRIYERYLSAWGDAGGDLFCNFSSISRWSKWGSWGLLQYYDDDPRRSPKFMAVMRWARSLGQPVNVPE
ncbi:MAG: hypothetical protein GXP27_08905 [Planctomycetes bacterium]|nr:hypothetical protein [Planctomycetota bacterium]